MAALTVTAAYVRKDHDALQTLLTDSFKREVDADEAIWRSLPFFAAITGVGVAPLPSVFSSVAGSPAGWLHGLAWGLFGCCMAAFGIAGYWFWQVIKLREYVYPPNDAALLANAEALVRYHQGNEPDAERADAAAASDLRQFVLHGFADASTNNRRNNSAKSAARSRVLLSLDRSRLRVRVSERSDYLGWAGDVDVARKRGIARRWATRISRSAKRSGSIVRAARQSRCPRLRSAFGRGQASFLSPAVRKQHSRDRRTSAAAVCSAGASASP